MPGLKTAVLLPLTIFSLISAASAFNFNTSLREGDVAAPAALVAEARLHMQWAALAYLHGKKYELCREDPAGEKCDSAKWDGVGDVTWFTENDSKDKPFYHAAIFLYTEPKKKEPSRIVLSFKGSDSTHMYMDNAKVKFQDAVQICGVCKVASVYHEVVISMWPAIRKKLIELRKQYPNAGISFTGHSAGAAMSTIATAFASRSRHFNDFDWTRFRLFTFASPRVGNEAFVEAMKDFPGAANYYVVINCMDPISNWPAYNDGWRHLSKFVGNKPPEQLYILCPTNPAKDFGKTKYISQYALSCGLKYPYSKKAGGDTCVSKYTDAKGRVNSKNLDGAKRFATHKALAYRVGLGEKVLKHDFDSLVKSYSGFIGGGVGDRTKAKLQKSKGGKLDIEEKRRRRRRWLRVGDA